MQRAASRHRIESGWGVLVLLAALAPASAAAQQREPDAGVALAVAQADAPRVRPPRLSLTLVPTLPGTAPGTQLGVRWSQQLSGGQAIVITAWRRMDEPADSLSMVQQRDPSFGARVELKIAPARSRFVSDLRFIGMQLDGGGRIGLRR